MSFVVAHVERIWVAVTIDLVPYYAGRALEEHVVVERVVVVMAAVAADVVGNNSFLANSKPEFCSYFPLNIENGPCMDRWLDESHTIDSND